MYCENCGSEVSSSANYCENCGTSLKSTSEPTPSDDTNGGVEENSKSQTRHQWEADHEPQPNERILTSLSANHTQSENRAVGGELFLTNQRLLFEPNSLDRSSGGESISIDLENIDSVSKASRGGRGWKDTIFGGGLTRRLRIDLHDQSSELFVIGNLDETINQIESVIDDGKIETADVQSEWKPAFPITSVFTAILFAWVTLDLSTVTAVFMFGLPGILVIPRVRRYVIRWVNERYDRDLTTGRIKGVGMVAYAILMFLALAFVIGSTANEPTVGGSPTRQVTVGILTIGIMFGIAAAIVTAIRMNRKLRN